MRKYLLTLIAILTAAGFLYPQSVSSEKEQLEQERRAIQNELKEIQEMYNKVKGQTKQSLGQLNMLTRKMRLQETALNF